MTERLIYANALIRCLDEKAGEGWNSDSISINMGYMDGIADAIHTIDDQITIEAIPVWWLSELNNKLVEIGQIELAKAIDVIIALWRKENDKKTD